jgi:hypothetical protein
MLKKDFILEYNGFGIQKGLCRLRIYENTSIKKNILLVTDLESLNPACSVTNGIERIRLALIEQAIFNEDSIIVEHYEKSLFESHVFDKVVFDEFGRPGWNRLEISELVILCETSNEELLSSVYDDPKLIDIILNKREMNSPEIDKPHDLKGNEKIRSENISKQMILKSSIQRLIDLRSGEQDFQKLLKKDLSVFGEIYANPNREYVCFSEFPVGDGFVDFAVFTGRSRMDVYLIEVKGANFNFCSNNSYESISAKINEAAQQVRKRIGVFNSNRSDFIRHVHAIRHDVENGKPRYNSLVSPFSPLGVDPNKEVWVYGIVIGGFSNDDLRESQLRHDYEYSTSREIRIESWQSWLKKLSRN